MCSLSGGAIFGIIFAVVVASIAFGFVYKRYDLGYYIPALPGRRPIVPYDAEIGITNKATEVEIGDIGPSSGNTFVKS